ncbi:MAG: FAD-dependent oxidoreductase [Clostridia bacterium]|nr:FAD-dependent oxidoreductase [Clostridia bacterium]
MINYKEKYDIIVVGGGFSGVACAISAARDGASVLLVEQTNCLGGAANINLVSPFMGNHIPKDGVERFPLSMGLFQEIVAEMKKLDGRSSEGMFSDESLKLVLQRMALSAGVALLFNTTFVRAIAENEMVTAVEFVNKSGVFCKEATYFVDATGDGDVAVSAGCPYQVGRNEDNLCQPMTLCFRVANVDIPAFEEGYKDLQKLYKEYQTAGKIKNPREDILRFHMVLDNVLHFNTTRVVKYDPTNGEDISQAEVIAREQVFEMMAFLKENAKGFEKAQLMSTAMRIGTRESRMIQGEYVLTEHDIMELKKFPDGIAACRYDMDIHSPDGSGTYHWFLPPGEYYTIPYRTLLPLKAKNMMVVGRCISSTHMAQASYRIMPVVCCIGEAAGTALAMAKCENIMPGQVDTDKLRSILVEHGAFVG